MRVVQSKPAHPEKVVETKKDDEKVEGGDEAEEEESSPEPDKKALNKILISGAVAKVRIQREKHSFSDVNLTNVSLIIMSAYDQDTTPEAVKAYHDKPVPSKQAVNHIPSNNIGHVQQPRKNNY